MEAYSLAEDEEAALVSDLVVAAGVLLPAAVSTMDTMTMNRRSRVSQACVQRLEMRDSRCFQSTLLAIGLVMSWEGLKMTAAKEAT